jgi:hypothetical protein
MIAIQWISEMQWADDANGDMSGDVAVLIGLVIFGGIALEAFYLRWKKASAELKRAQNLSVEVAERMRKERGE